MPVNVGIVSLQSPTEEIDPEDADNNTDVKVTYSSKQPFGCFECVFLPASLILKCFMAKNLCP